MEEEGGGMAETDIGRGAETGGGGGGGAGGGGGRMPENDGLGG